LRLISVGRLSTAKNTAAAVRALDLLRQRLPVTLAIVGDGPCRKDLVGLVEHLGLGDLVQFHGNVAHDEVLRLLCRSHLLVFPTRVAEGFPKVVIEAMACGVPVVAPPVSALASLLNGEVGARLASVEPISIAEACRSLADEERWRVASKGALALASAYSLEAWRDRIGECLSLSWGVPLRCGDGS
jgi:glycosyltransferase involved in cell wall biosynthesis